MSWIKTVPYAEASGELKKIYDETKVKFGKVINLVKIQEDFTQVEFDPKTKALLDFAKKTTLTPKKMGKSDIEELQKNGFSDKEILDAAQLIGYFNYSNRVMDCLGINPEPEMRYKKEDYPPCY